MSRNSKAKRDKRKKSQPKRPFLRLDRDPQVANHAVMVDEDQRVVAAIGQQAGGEWLLSIGGQTMGNADNPVPMLAMLKHLAGLQQKEGKTVEVQYSEQMQQMIDDLAADEGKTAEEYLTQLVSEFQDNGDDDEDLEDEAAADEAVDEAPDAAAPDVDTTHDDTPAKGA
ncbi:MAG TPA: hypothetical protein VGC74_04920 [Stenotrophomonas sp.]